MKQYRLESGRLVKVRPEHEQQFLQNNPTATLVSGNIQSPAQDATAGQETAASNQEASQPQNNTELNLEDGSSESQKEDKGLITTLSGLGRGFASIYQGLGSITEAIEVTATELLMNHKYGKYGFNLTPEQRKKLRYTVKAESYISNVARGSTLSSMVMEPVIQDLSDNIPDFDTSITEDFQKGNYAQAAKRTVDGFAESAASFVAAAIPGGLVVLGAGTAGNKYEEEILNSDNDDQHTAKLLANSIGNGTIEAGFEYFTRGLLKKVGIVKGTSGEAAKEFLENGSKSILKKLGLAGWSTVKEGSSEAATEFTSALWDALPKEYGGLGKEINYNELAYRMSDAYIIGSFSGGVFESVGAVRNETNKIQAESTLMDEGSKNEIIKAQSRISKLQEDLTDADGDEKQLIYDQIKSEAEDIKSIRAKNSINLSGLEGENLKTYADNVDTINKSKKAYVEAKTETGKELAKNKYEQLTKENNNLLEQARANVVAKEKLSVEQEIKKAGLEGSVKEMTSQEIESMESTEKFDSKDAAQSYGFIRDFGDGSFEIILNKDKPAVGVAAHEFLHAVLKSTLKGDIKVGEQLASALNSHVDTLEGDQTKLKDRLKSYEGDQNIGEETITLMSESILNGDLKFNEGFFTKVGDVIRRFLQSTGIKDIEFNTGQDVYNFIKDYNKSIKTGKTNKAIVKVAKEGAKGKLVEGVKETTEESVKASRDAKGPIDQLGKVDSDGNDMTEPGIGNFLYQAEADEVVRKIKEEGYLDNLIAAKYKVRPVPEAFVQDVLAELTTHIKSFKPESNDSLFGWIQSQIANKAGNVYNKIYKDKGPARTVDVDATTSEGAPIVQIEADTDIEMQRIDEIGLDDTEVEERSRLRRDIRLDEGMMQTVRNAVIKTFGTKLPDVQAKDFRAALQKAFRTELKKPIQDMIGGRSEYDLFLRNHSKAIFKALPVETLVQMERNLKPEQRIFTESRRITKPTEVDKLISEGKLPKNTSRTAGPQLHTKKPFPGIDKILAYFRGTDMDELLGYKVGASTLGTRKDKLAMSLGEELAFDATSEVLQDPEVKKKRQGILELQGKTQEPNELATISSIINRDPNVKFSKNNEKQVVEYLEINAGKSGLQIIKERGIVNPAVKKTIQRLSRKTGLPKDIKVSDMSAEIIQRLGKELRRTTLGEETARLLNIFGSKNPLYKTVLYTAMTNDESRNFIGSKRVFESLVGTEPLAKADFLARFAFNKNKKLDPNRVKLIDGKLVFIDGKGNKYSGAQILKFERQKLSLLIDMFKDIEAHLKENPSDAWFFAKFVGDAASNGNAIFRTSASIIGAYVKDGKLDYNSEMVEEHMMPQNNIGSILLAAAIDSNSLINVETIGKVIKASFTQLSLLKTDDLKLDAVDSEVTGQKSLVSKMPKDFWNIVVPRIISGELNLDDGMAAIIRYVQAGINLNNYMHAPTNQTFTSYFGVNTNLKGKTDQQVDAIVEKQNDLISKQLKGEVTKDQAIKEIAAFANTNATIYKQGAKTRALAMKAEANLVKYSKTGSAKGMSTFDFDETLIIGGENFVIATHPETNDVIKILSHEWPIKGPDLAAQDYQFDFSDFANVRGGKEGPLLQKMKNQIKKYGNKNVFVLTARQQDSAKPIKEWLKSQGIDIPLRNITGLGKSEGEAKGEWMLQKFAEGYNDMYFVDDALPNVEAVRKVLDQLDIKSKVVQAKIKFSKSASKDFNDMLERSKGVATSTRISDVDAKLRGAKRDRFRIRFFVPPSAEDLKGLVYAFLDTGKQGDKDLAWFRDNLFNPFADGNRRLNSLRQKMSEEYTSLKKEFPNVVKSLNDKVANTEFTVDNAIRVYLWNMAGFETPGLSESQKNLLIDHVAKNAELVAYADVLSNITRTEEGYVKPKDYWITQNIGSDLHTLAETTNRTKFLAEWQENADLIFSKENLNKIEAIYGSNFREALEDMLYRMKTGSNRPSGRTSTENKFLNWINGAVSAVMFFNMRSAGLQGLSMVNFLNFEDNNIFKASKAFANQKQFWSDFAYLFNSDMLKQRRAGLKIDVSASELTDAFAQGKNKTEAVIKYMLEKGFIPTKMMDSFAIAMGGSTFYRNRVEKYLNEGMSKSDAENQAFLDFQEIAEETQQSSRPDLISMQQASSLGRLILAWANTPMQYTRLTKKALSDIVNRRGDLKANVSRILYYGAVQNIIFGTLQTGLAFLMFGDDEEDKDRDKKETRVLNGMLDTLLRGVGVYGALVSTAKNALIAAYEELGKGFGRKDYSKIMQQLINLSPPIGSKVRKIMSSIKSYDFNKDIINQMDHGINNPAWNVFTGVVEGATNVPLDRIRAKLVNVREAFVGDHEMWQRVALALGWSKWDVNVKDADIEEARRQVKENREESKKKDRAKKFRCVASRSNGERCNMIVDKQGSKCVHHRPFKDGSDNDGDGLKEYRCKAITSSGKRCKNKTENKNKKCYAHQ